MRDVVTSPVTVYVQTLCNRMDVYSDRRSDRSSNLHREAAEVSAMKKPVPVFTAGKKKSIPAAIKAAPKVIGGDIGLTRHDCICATMMPHCPVHAVRRFPAPGCDVIR